MYSCLVSTYRNINLCGNWFFETMTMRAKPLSDTDQEYISVDNIFVVHKMER